MMMIFRKPPSHSFVFQMCLCHSCSVVQNRKIKNYSESVSHSLCQHSGPYRLSLRIGLNYGLGLFWCKEDDIPSKDLLLTMASSQDWMRRSIFQGLQTVLWSDSIIDGVLGQLWSVETGRRMVIFYESLVPQSTTLHSMSQNMDLTASLIRYTWSREFITHYL